MRAAVAAALLGIALPPQLMPPSQYRSPVRAVIITTSTQAEVDAACGRAGPGERKAACARIGAGTQPYVVMPNPCRFAEHFPDEELYAAMLCHELAHTQGWKHK